MYGRVEKLATKSQLLITEMSAYVNQPAVPSRPPLIDRGMAAPPDMPPLMLPATWLESLRPLQGEPQRAQAQNRVDSQGIRMAPASSSSS
eukprot:3178841-Amphidinium_carterae.1